RWGPEDARRAIAYGFAHGVPDAPGPPGSRSTGTGPSVAPRPTAPPRPAGAGQGIGGRTFLLATLAGAGTALAVSRHAALAPSLQAGLACALAVFGLGLVLSAWLGRTG